MSQSDHFLVDVKANQFGSAVENEGTLKERSALHPGKVMSRSNVKQMQLFMAQLSGDIDKLQFEQSWKSDGAIDPGLDVVFGFVGRTVSIKITSDLSNQWKSDALHRTFSSAIHRVDQRCNIRWL